MSLFKYFNIIELPIRCEKYDSLLINNKYITSNIFIPQSFYFFELFFFFAKNNTFFGY